MDLKKSMYSKCKDKRCLICQKLIWSVDLDECECVKTRSGNYHVFHKSCTLPITNMFKGGKDDGSTHS